MNRTLAIIAPEIGARSETFIRRHMQSLLPNHTVVIVAADRSDSGDWRVDCPVLVMNWLSEDEDKNCNIRPAKPLTANAPWLAVKQFLQAHQVQVMMGEYLNLCFPWIQIAQELNIPFFGHAHGYDVSHKLRDVQWQQKYLHYNQTGGIIAMSQTSQKRLLRLGLHPDRVHVVPYGVDVPAMPLKKTQQATIRCLAVGRMVEKKAPLKTLEAFRQATEVCSTLRLDYIGAGQLLPAAQAFVKQFNLENQVCLHGGQPNTVVKQLMEKADIFVQHSITVPESGDEEGLPVAILEAMAHSLPVVSTHHAGIPEAVADGSTGYLVDEGDVGGMASCLIELARDSDLRQHMGIAGWSRAKAHFSWEREQKDLLKILGLNGATS